MKNAAVLTGISIKSRLEQNFFYVRKIGHFAYCAMYTQWFIEYAHLS